VSRLDLAVIAAFVVVGAAWIETRHRVVIEPPTRTKEASPGRAAGCPDNENEPYSASCLLFMGIISGIRSQANAAEGTPAVAIDPPRDAEFSAGHPTPPCPDTDNVPYDANCLRFLSGRYWRVDPASGMPAPTAK